MKKLMMTVVLLASMTAVSAQEKSKGSGAQTGTNLTAADTPPAMDLNKVLGLSEEQIMQVSAVNKTFVAERATLEKAGLTGADMEERLAVIRKTRDVELESILSPEQLAKLNGIREETKDYDAMPGMVK